MFLAQRRDGEADGEGRPLPLAVALRSYRAAVQLDQVAHDREPQAEAAMAARRVVGLAETLEDMRQEIRADAQAVIADPDLCVAAGALQADLDAAVGPG